MLVFFLRTNFRTAFRTTFWTTLRTAFRALFEHSAGVMRIDELKEGGVLTRALKYLLFVGRDLLAILSEFRLSLVPPYNYLKLNARSPLN